MPSGYTTMTTVTASNASGSRLSRRIRRRACPAETCDVAPSRRTSSAIFCEECGTALATRCAHCSTELSPTAKFCAECGRPVSVDGQIRFASPTAYTPKHLAEKILTSRAALEGERKQVTVLFADLK